MKKRAPRNRTLTCSEAEIDRLSTAIFQVERPVNEKEITEKIIGGDTFEVAENLPKGFVNLLVLDPPYNLSKNYNGHIFKTKEKDAYQKWFQHAIEVLTPTLTPDATIYVCSDWKTSVLIAPILESHFHIRNRITWEREKGRGAKTNWKNNTEDIWFCTASDSYYFDVDAVKLKRKVIAPYRIDGKPKDWKAEEIGNYRLTHPSNIWTDITIPFWSMPENTDHPTQKPEKLIAKLILASSRKDDFVFDPFLGSGTTAVVAKKLGRRFCGIELNREYCCWALKRLELATRDLMIQGYADGVFWERNTLSDQPKPTQSLAHQKELFS
ncbi:MAG: site-specific DNA-methyltransferase [Chlorobi bacterium]|nr:site-specific DNA-methyltransferase [Chlorobiota bacterium]